MRHLRLVLVLCASVISMCALTAGAGASDPSPPVRVVYAMNPADWKFDPATAYNPSMWQVEYATCAKLVDFPDAGGAAGLTLAPDAASLPQVTPDGPTYTFTIQSGLHFSSGEAVTADSFRVAIERALKLNTGPDSAPVADYLSAVQGVSAYLAGASSISGLSVSGNQLAFTLTRPDGALPAKLAEPFFCAVPVGTPYVPQTSPLPSAGPYYIDPVGASNAGFRLLRNPNYGGSRPSVLPEIDVTVGGTASDAVNGAKSNPATVDYAAAVASSSSDAANYGSASPAALAGHQQYFESPVLGTASLAMNTTTPALQNVSVRKAIATILNRNTLASLTSAFRNPTDQFLPPNMPGYRDEPLYPLGGDVAAAQGLMQAANYGPSNHLALRLVTTSSPLNAEIVSELAAAYIDVTLTTKSQGDLSSFIASNPSGYDLTVIRWLVDYADAENMLAPFFDGTELAKSGNLNYARFDDPGYNDQFQYARGLVGDARAVDYGNLDIDIAQHAAPMAAIASSTRADFFSSRIGCQVDQPVYGFDFTSLCIASAVAPGDTATTGADATPSAPVQTSVTSPVGGSVSVTGGGGASDVSGYNVLGTSLSIEAPAASPAAPLRIEFEIDAATLAEASADASSVTVFRNGTAKGDCTTSDGTATPDPCVTSRNTDGQGDAHIVVLTSHASTWSFGKADTTAPALRSTALSRNPILAGSTTTLSASADPDAVAAEFFVGSDAGAGNNTPLNGGAGSFTSPAFGSLLTSGVYPIGVRVRDRARNWSPVQYQYLVVYNAQSSVTGGGFIVPSAAAGDVLPGLDGKSKANLGFLVQYAAGAAVPTGDLEFNYNVAKLRFHAASFDWLVEANSSASFQGRGTLGNSSDTSIFRVNVVDGSTDRFSIKIWSPGASADVDAPLYSASGAVAGGQIVVK